MAGIPASIVGESVGRRLRAAALRGLPLHQRPWLATPAYVGGATYQIGEVVRATNGHLYCAIGAGAASATEPTHLNATTVANGGTAVWSHIGPVVGDTADDTGAPTLTLTGSASIPSGLHAVYPAHVPHLFAIRGGSTSVYATNYLKLVQWLTDGATEMQGQTSVSFVVTGSRFGVQNLSGTAGFLVRINDRPLRNGALLANPAGLYWADITFTDGATEHEIEICYPRSSSTLMSIAVQPGCTIRPPADTDSLSVALIGDSYQEGSNYGPYVPGNTLSQCLARRLGIKRVRAYAKGGTGLLNKGVGSAFLTYRERLPQVLANPFDVLFVYGSTNDTSQTVQAITDEANLFIEDARSAFGGPIVWMGPVPLNPASVANIGNVDAGISAACAGRRGVYYVSPYTDGWMTTTDTGVSYIANIIGTDNQHPVDKGTRYLASRWADRCVQSIWPLIR